MSTIDWTDYFSRKEISDTAEYMIDETIREIHLKRLTIHTAYDLTVDEIDKLYRWPLFVGVNSFVERLVRTLHDINRGQITHFEIVGKKSPEYYIDINASASAYYNDIILNYTLSNFTKLHNSFFGSPQKIHNGGYK